MINQGVQSPFQPDGSSIYSGFIQAAVRGKIFHGANTTAVTTQAGLSATTPALTLYNPVGSGVNLILLKVSFTWDVQPVTSCVVMLAANLAAATAPATVTNATIKSSLLGSTTITPAGKCYSICTLGAAPLAISFLGAMNSTAASLNATPGFIDGNFNGLIVLDPGVALSIQTSSAASIRASFTWFEDQV